MSREEQQDKTFVVSCAVRKHLREVNQSFFLSGQWLKIRNFAGCLHMNGIESTWKHLGICLGWGFVVCLFVSVLTYTMAMSIYLWFLTLGSFCLFILFMDLSVQYAKRNEKLPLPKWLKPRSDFFYDLSSSLSCCSQQLES